MRVRQILRSMGRHEEVPGIEHARKGAALLMVVVALGLTCAVTLAFLETQTISTRVTNNSIGNRHAEDAAETAARLTLRQMHSASWAGVNKSLSGQLWQTAEGTASYEATFHPVNVSATTLSQLLRVEVRCTGRFTPAVNSSIPSQKTIRLIVEMRPRVELPGSSTSLPADWNPPSNESISTRPYSLTLASNSNSALVVDPSNRVEGPLWLRGRPVIFGDPLWSTSTRQIYLQHLAQDYGALSDIEKFPHPFAQKFVFSNSGSANNSTVAESLALLGVPVEISASHPPTPTFSISSWSQYRLYDKGFVYNAQTLGSSLSWSELRPTPANPLGIYIRQGDLRIQGNTTIVGTLIATGRITIEGTNNIIVPVRLTDLLPADLRSSALSTTLPTVMAQFVEFDRECFCHVEGLVQATRTITGAGASWRLRTNSTAMGLTGTLATASVSTQPFSSIRIDDDVNFDAINSGWRHQMTLFTGGTGRTLPIVSVDKNARRVTVAGQVTTTGPVAWRMSRTPQAEVRILGRLWGDTANFNRASHWDLSSLSWTLLRTQWEQTNSLLAATGQAEMTLTRWLANSANVNWLGSYQATFAQNIEPTLHLHDVPVVNEVTSLPILRASTITPPGGVIAGLGTPGYQWLVISREILP